MARRNESSRRVDGAPQSAELVLSAPEMEPAYTSPHSGSLWSAGPHLFAKRARASRNLASPLAQLSFFIRGD